MTVSPGASILAAAFRFDAVPASPAASAGLITAPKDANPRTRHDAVKCLTDSARDAKASVPELRDTDKEVRDAAASAVKKITPKK